MSLSAIAIANRFQQRIRSTQPSLALPLLPLLLSRRTRPLISGFATTPSSRTQTPTTATRSLVSRPSQLRQSSRPLTTSSPLAEICAPQNGSSPAPATVMDLNALIDRLRSGASAKFPAEANSVEFARKLDSQDVLKHLRDEFILPTRRDLRKRALDGQKAATNGTSSKPDEEDATGSSSSSGADDHLGIYFVGNSLGAQPKAIKKYVAAQLETWGSLGVQGHFVNMANSPLVQWQDMAEDCANKSAAIVGALPHEVVVMNSLTINLHMMMASFYRPDRHGRHKIILESRPFPSDHYAIESQIRWHGLDPADCMVKIAPDDETSLIPTDKILRAIDEHADTAALLLLPGIQYYSGQLFDMARITAYARKRGITVGWDLAHAAGNVELKLHDWDVDFACWCTYKYINAGPGAIAGAFIHERHGAVKWTTAANGNASSDDSSSNGNSNSNNDHSNSNDDHHRVNKKLKTDNHDAAAEPRKPTFRPRLMGWYGGDKSVRFNMDMTFVPTPGAAGYQVSNPSAMDLACLSGALSVFGKTSMRDLRSKSLALTAYAQALLEGMLEEEAGSVEEKKAATVDSVEEKEAEKEKEAAAAAAAGSTEDEEKKSAAAAADPTEKSATTTVSAEKKPLFRIITPLDPAQRGAQLSLLLRPGLMDKLLVALEENGVMCDKRKPDVIRVAPVPLYSRFEDVWRFMQVFRGALGLRA